MVHAALPDAVALLADETLVYALPLPIPDEAAQARLQAGMIPTMDAAAGRAGGRINPRLEAAGH